MFQKGFKKGALPARTVSPLMPINCLVKCLFNFWTVMFQKSIHGQFVNNSWTFMFQKDGPFVFHPFVFGGSVAQNGGLSLFNTRPAHVANALKTKDLRKRHFRLKFLSPGKPLRLRTLGAKLAQWFVHFPADPTLHTPPETDPTCSAAKPCTM